MYNDRCVRTAPDYRCTLEFRARIHWAGQRDKVAHPLTMVACRAAYITLHQLTNQLQDAPDLYAVHCQ